MQCKNHPDVAAVDRCAGCAEAFCGDCLVELKGKKYCANCKVMVLAGKNPQPPEHDLRPCPEAGEALKYAIIGIFCFGIILGAHSHQQGAQGQEAHRSGPAAVGHGQGEHRPGHRHRRLGPVGPRAARASRVADDVAFPPRNRRCAS